MAGIVPSIEKDEIEDLSYMLKEDGTVDPEKLDKQLNIPPPKAPELDIKDVNQLVSILWNQPYEVKARERKMRGLARKVMSINAKREEIEKLTLADVSKEVDEAGKKRYSNVDSREGEHAARLKMNTEYKLLSDELSTIQELQSENQIELDYLKRQTKAIETIVDLHKIALRLI